jgi:hypothetical protein
MTKFLTKPIFMTPKLNNLTLILRTITYILFFAVGLFLLLFICSSINNKTNPFSIFETTARAETDYLEDGKVYNFISESSRVAGTNLALEATGLRTGNDPYIYLKTANQSNPNQQLVYKKFSTNKGCFYINGTSKIINFTDDKLASYDESQVECSNVSIKKDSLTDTYFVYFNNNYLYVNSTDKDKIAKATYYNLDPLNSNSRFKILKNNAVSNILSSSIDYLENNKIYNFSPVTNPSLALEAYGLNTSNDPFIYLKTVNQNNQNQQFVYKETSTNKGCFYVNGTSKIISINNEKLIVYDESEIECNNVTLKTGYIPNSVVVYINGSYLNVANTDKDKVARADYYNYNHLNNNSTFKLSKINASPNILSSSLDYLENGKLYNFSPIANPNLAFDAFGIKTGNDPYLYLKTADQNSPNQQLKYKQTSTNQGCFYLNGTTKIVSVLQEKLQLVDESKATCNNLKFKIGSIPGTVKVFIDSHYLHVTNIDKDKIANAFYYNFNYFDNNSSFKITKINPIAINPITELIKDKQRITINSANVPNLSLTALGARNNPASGRIKVQSTDIYEENIFFTFKKSTTAQFNVGHMFLNNTSKVLARDNQGNLVLSDYSNSFAPNITVKTGSKTGSINILIDGQKIAFGINDNNKVARLISFTDLSIDGELKFDKSSMNGKYLDNINANIFPPAYIDSKVFNIRSTYGYNLSLSASPDLNTKNDNKIYTKATNLNDINQNFVVKYFEPNKGLIFLNNTNKVLSTVNNNLILTNYDGLNKSNVVFQRSYTQSNIHVQVNNSYVKLNVTDINKPVTTVNFNQYDSTQILYLYPIDTQARYILQK